MRFPPLLKSFSTVSDASSAREPPAPVPDDVPLGLTVLHPKNGNDEKALVDIITIHGLSGHPKKTWTNSKTGHYWPLKSLPQDIPLSRIMAFGYSTNTSPFNNSTAIMSDIAKSLLSHLINKRQTEKQKIRPMIFVAHSLGGIVLKEFLHVASNNGNDDMAGCVCGILFLGTPHKGSDLASFLNVLNAVTKSLFRRPPDVIIQDLSANSRHLLELDQLLRFKLGKIDIYSFYELKPMGSMKNPIVERHSALMNLPSEIEQIGLDADHRQMCKPLDRNDFIYETIVGRIINIMHRQIDRELFSKELMNMTNDFATRQMEQISLLATVQSHQKPDEAFPAIFMASFSEIRSPDLTVQPNALVDVLKDLPRPKAMEYLGGLQKLFDRAESLHNMLRFAERQSEQMKAEAMKIRFEAERKADKQKIADLKAENEELKEELKALKLITETSKIPIQSKEPIADAKRGRMSRRDETASMVEHERVSSTSGTCRSRREEEHKERRRSRRDSYEVERMVDEERIDNTNRIRRSRRDSFEMESRTETQSITNTRRSRSRRRDSYGTERIFERQKPQHRSQHEDIREGYKLIGEGQRTKNIHEETSHGIFPGATIAAAIAFECVKYERKSPEDSSQCINSQRNDSIQQEADRYYRESMMARRLACGENDSPERSVVNKWRDDDSQYFPIIISSEIEEHEEPHRKGIYDGPDADVLIDNRFFPHQEHQFQVEPANNGETIFQSKDPIPERGRPILNLIYPTPVQSREASASSSEGKATRAAGPELPEVDMDDVTIEPTSQKMEPIPGSFGDDADFTATLSRGLMDIGFNSDIVVEDVTFHRRESPPGVQEGNTGHTRRGAPYIEADLGSPQNDADEVVNQLEEEWDIPTKGNKKKKKMKRGDPGAAFFEEAVLRDLDSEVEMPVDNAEQIPGSDEQKLVQTRIKSEDMLKSLQAALTQGQQLFESLDSVATNTSDQGSPKGSDDGSVYGYDDEGSCHIQ